VRMADREATDMVIGSPGSCAFQLYDQFGSECTDIPRRRQSL